MATNRTPEFASSEFGGDGDDDVEEDRAGDTESEKRKRRQDRHRLLERRRRERTQQLLLDIQEELDKHTDGSQHVGIGSFTLNKALQHVVQHVKLIARRHDASKAVKAEVGMLPPSIGAPATPGQLQCPADLEGTCGFEQGAEDPDAELVRLAILACTTPVAFVCMDGTLLECNNAFTQLLGYQQGEVEGQSFYLHAAPLDMAQLMQAVFEVVQDPSRTLSPIVRLLLKNGMPLACQLDISGCKVGPGRVFMIFYVTVLSEAPAGQGAGPAPAFPLHAPDPYAASRMGQQAADDLSGVGPQHLVGVGSIYGSDSGGMLSYGDMISNSGMLHPQDPQLLPQQPSQMAQPLTAQPQMVSPEAMPPYTVEIGPEGQMQQMSFQNGQNMQLQPPPLPHQYPHMHQPMQHQPMQHQPMQHQPMQQQPMQQQPMQQQPMQQQPMQQQPMQQPLQWGMLEDDIAGSSQAMPASGLAGMPLLAQQNVRGGGLNLTGAASRLGPSMLSPMGEAGELDDPLWPFADGAGARSMSHLALEGKAEELWDAAPSMFVQQPY